MKFVRLNDPLQTKDEVLMVASLEDLLGTKLKAILDRAEAKDYRDIAEMTSSGTSLERSLAAFAKMFNADVALPLRAIGFFKEGDLPSLSESDQLPYRYQTLCIAACPRERYAFFKWRIGTDCTGTAVWTSDGRMFYLGAVVLTRPR